MRIETEAIVLSSRGHAEHGAVVRMMTRDHGLQAAYVRGAKGRRMRPVLLGGNRVSVRLSARHEGQLGQAELELIHSLGPLHSEPLAAAAIEWSTALTAAALPESHPYPRVYDALDGLLLAIEAAPSAIGWGGALVRYELLLLAEMGFGLDLDRCAVTGGDADLVAVSPRSGRGVSAPAAEPYAASLLPLPAFLRTGELADWKQVDDGLRLTGHFLSRDILTDRLDRLGPARARLVDRLRRAGGLA